MGFRWLSRQRYLRAIGILSLILPLSLLSCGDRSAPTGTMGNPAVGTAGISGQPTGPALANGDYPVQQAQYNDANGEYALTLLNLPAGVRPVYTTQRLRMAQVSAADRRAGKASFLRLNGASATLYLTPNFSMNYVHNVTETQVNPQTGQQETVVVRQETTAWQPMANRGDRATEVMNVYQPYYYLPPRYSTGSLYGYGGYGPTYDVAERQYQTRYNEPPLASRTTSFRSSGNLRSTPGTATSPATSPTADAPGSIAKPTTSSRTTTANTSPPAAGSVPPVSAPGSDLRQPGTGNTSGSSPTGSSPSRSMSSPAANPDGSANPSQTNQPTTTKPTTSTPTHTGSRSSGAGYGSSTLHTGGSSGSTSPRRSSSSASSSTRQSSFGSGSSRSRSSSGGSRRR